MPEINTRHLLSEAKFYESYSRWDDSKQRYETWEEAVKRVMDMHRRFYKDKMSPRLAELIDEAEKAYVEKKVLGAQRALQFGGDQLLKNHARMYNCVSSYADRPAFFGEYFWMLLSGAGAGFSVQKHHVAKLPKIQERKKTAKSYVIEDSIEGWADALSVLMSSFFVGGGVYSEFEGRRVYFDLSKIRPKGSFISGGFKAPGPEPLRKCLDKVEYLLQGKVLRGDFQLRPIEVYDICMHVADAVLAGGVRRAATIALFSVEDEEMINAKTGNWFVENPQRARSNNSAMVKRDEITREQFATIFKRVKEFGEPGFIFTDSYEFTYNPCVTGDTKLIVKDHNVMFQGEKVAEGVVYEMTVEQVTKMYEEMGYAPLVLSKNLETGELEFKQITWAGQTRKNAEILEVIGEKSGKSIRCTPDHKIWTTNRGWVEAKDLTEEDELDIHYHSTRVNVAQKVEKKAALVKKLNYVEDVYDITVEDNHNFYGNGILVHNCVEIGKYPVDIETGKTGWQACNLCEINGAMMTSFEALVEASKAAAILGTLQAGYTHFPYLEETSKKIIEREALLGVSITGWMNNPSILFDEENLKNAANVVKDINKEVAKLIDINPAARTTCCKPSGNASVLLGTASGIHPEHSPRYLRHVQMNKEMEVAQFVKKTNPYMVEDSIWSAANSDYMLAFPVISPKNSIYKEETYGVNLLEKVKLAQSAWVEHGTDESLCVDPRLRHNISNTITVLPDQWEEVEEYVYNNRQFFAGISFLSASGDRDYYQAPFTAVKTPEEIIKEYGSAGIFASGLVTDAIKVFSNLWRAIDVAKDETISSSQDRLDTQMDWIRRFRKFANNFFKGDLQKAGYCLKDVAILHKFEKIQQNFIDIDFTQLQAKKYTDVDTMGAVACSGGACEIF